VNNHLNHLRDFIKEYDSHNNLTFSGIQPFPQAKILYPFGLFFIQRKLELNIGTFFEKQRVFLLDTISPFNFKEVFYDEDNDMITLCTSFGFSLRIYNVKFETISNSFWRSLDQSLPIEKNTLLCKSGKPKSQKPTKTYLEVVSEKQETFLHDLLQIKFQGKEIDQPIDNSFILDFLTIFGKDHTEGKKELDSFIEKEDISFYNPYYCIKKDKLSQKELIFYSWSALFN
jgi:hypothetical protein